MISLAFYGKSSIKGIYFILGYSLIVYLMGRIIEKYRRHQFCQITLFLIVILGYLFVCKYLDFVCRILKTEKTYSVWIPIGISFITFSAISYLVDIYKGNAECGTITETVLYLVFFPKVISGPIVLWKDFAPQITRKPVTTDQILKGVNRIMIGFGKKLILADYFGSVVYKIQEQGLTHVDTATVWISVLLYSMQIYFDFSGYSDIAIGLGKIFGFQFKENFAFPYRALSITEFWRRWHISLGTWFKEYLYIPLGGNRKGAKRTLLNLGVVFLVTGIWHGAGWNYIAWGCAHGICVIIERCIKKKTFYKKTPLSVKWFVTFLIVSLGWQTFALNSFSKTIRVYEKLIGFGVSENIVFSWRYFASIKTVSLLGVAFLGATLLGSPRLDRIKRPFNSESVCAVVIKEVGVFAIMFLAVMCMYNTSYSPFIYFQY